MLFWHGNQVHCTVALHHAVQVNDIIGTKLLVHNTNLMVMSPVNLRAVPPQQLTQTPAPAIPACSAPMV
jgi:hypothetical protein